MNELTVDGVYLPTKNAAFRRICDEVVIVDTANNRMMTLNETGAAIWMMLGEKTILEIAASLQESFQVDGERAVQDVLGFLAGLVERGLVAPRDAEPGSAP